MTSSPPSPTRRPPWGWALLALAIAWAALIRAPLVLNAESHLDSDLAVDGLTLIDALNGRWRWHYPATPFIGSPPVLLSYLQARVWGPGPTPLASGGVVAYALVVSATYSLNRRAFGPTVAAWGLVPLAFASTGAIWLSGRVTGGHLLATAWHAWAFALLWGALTRGGLWRWAALGLWSGFGLYVDSMFAVTWAGLAVAVFSASLSPRERAGVRDGGRGVSIEGAMSGAVGHDTPLTPDPSPKGRGEADGGKIGQALACLLAFALATGLGVAPRVIGQRVDPHDAYVGQFTPILEADHLARNAGLLALDCLPRLISGHRLPGLQAEPEPGRPSRPPKGVAWLALAVSVASLGLFAWAMGTLAIGETTGPASLAVRLGLLASTLAVLGGFLAHPSITDSDNYRYLVFLLVPWSSGFGLLMARLASNGRGGSWAAALLALGFAALMTADSGRWYARLGWIDQAARPVRKVVDDPALAWLDAHPSASTILGDYWDVYRLSYLTRGRVRGVPFPQYPNRFPDLEASGERVVIVRPGPFGPIYRAKALAGGGREVKASRGLSIVEWPEGMAP